MKCLPREKVSSAKGNVLHDWHAEVLCLRGFNRWVLDECAELAARGDGEWVRWNEDKGEAGPPFALRDNVKIHMYCTEAPCGDASMELTMAEQEDATPWSSSPDDGMLGRGHFDQLGIVRRKPSRPDAPICWSKSCSDKISLKQCTGLLSGLGSLIVRTDERCYLTTLVLPETQCIPKAVERAFGREGRMADVVGWQEREGGFALRPFEVKTTEREFAFSKHAVESVGAGGLVSSNLSALYTPRRQEVLINGVLQGRKQIDPKGASCVSRRRMWEGVLEVAAMANLPALESVSSKERKYGDLKEHQMLEGRERVKRVVREKSLKEWKRNDGDEDWSLEGGESMVK